MSIWQEERPCWSARCDQCGEGESHFDTREELLDALEAIGWYVMRGLFGEPVELYCKMCADEMIDRMRGLRAAWLE